MSETILIQQYAKLDTRLTLLAWLNYLLGYRSNRELLADTQGADEGFDASGQSFLYHRLLGHGGQVKIPAADLARYDENIRADLAAINRGRPEPIILRYFQYLAALYTEIYLDCCFNRRGHMLADLNAFVQQRNGAATPPNKRMQPTRSARSLRSLAPRAADARPLAVKRTLFSECTA